MGGSYVANAALYSSIEMPDQRTLPEVSIGGKLCRFTERVPSPETWLPSSPTWTDAFSNRHRSSQLSNIGCQGPVTHLFDGGVCSWVSARAPGGSNSAEWVAFDTMRTVTVTKIRLAAGTPEGAPRNFKLQVSNSLDGAWRDVLNINDAQRTTDSLQYEVNANTTSRFYRFVVSATQDRNTAVNLRSLMLFGGPANVVQNRLEALRCRVPVGSGQKASIRVRTMGVQAGVSSDLSFGFAPRDCLVSDWSDWSDCSRDCVGLGAANGHSHTGAGQTKRTRRVLRQEENGGRTCPSLEEVKTCNSDKTCPVHCAYDEWTPWTPAIISKGETMTRSRQIKRAAAHGGDACDGEDDESFQCPSGVCRDGKRDVEFENSMQVWLRPSSIMVVDEDKTLQDKLDSLDSFKQNWQGSSSSGSLEPLMIPKSGADSFRFREETEFSFRKSLRAVASYVKKATNQIHKFFTSSSSSSSSEWTKVVEMNNRKVTTNLGKDKFNELFNKCGVVRYTRKGKTTSVYKRLTQGLSNPYDLFTNNWFSSNNKLNQDFEIYSTESDLRSSRDKWTYCNYDDPGIGYPRDCGKTGYRGGTWFSIKRLPQKQLSTFEIYTGDDCPGYSSAPDSGDLYAYVSGDSVGVCDPTTISTSSCNELAGTYHVWYKGGKRTTDMIISCDGKVEQPNIFKDTLHFDNVRSKCTQDRDRDATMYIEKTHGASKYECLKKVGTTIKGSHYTNVNEYWGTIEYRLAKKDPELTKTSSCSDKVNFIADENSVYTLGVHVTSQGVTVMVNDQVKLKKDITNIETSALKIRSCGQVLISGLEAVGTKRTSEANQQVVAWHDDSGKGHNAFITSLEASPLVSMSPEKSAQLRLDTSSGLRLTNFSLSDSYDIFLDLRYVSGGRGRLFDSATERENWLCGAWAGKNGFHDSDLGWIGSPTSAVQNKWTVAECSLDDGMHEFKLNGVSKAKKRDTRRREHTIPIAIGYVPGASHINTEKTPGEFRNILIFKGGSLNQEQRNDVERFLNL